MWSLHNLSATIRESAPRREELPSRLRDRWYVLLAAVGTVIQLVSLRRVLGPVTGDTYPPLKDSIIFEYIGWYVTHGGGRLYVDIWEIKPPLSFEIPALLALVSGGDVRLYHLLNLAVTNAAVVGCAVVVGLTVYELTEDEAASFTGGLALFALPVFHWRAAYGFKSKYFVVLFGLLAVYLALKDRPFAAGAAGAATVGIWQMGIVFPVLALALGYQRGSRRAVGRVIAGGGLVAAIMLAPVVWWGALEAMIAETVLTPLLVTNNPRSASDQLTFAIRLFGWTLPLVVLGLFGLLLGVRTDLRRRWWLLPGVAWFALQIVALDLDFHPDLIPGFAFVALGIGLLLGDAGDRSRDGSDHIRRAIHGLVAVMVVLSVVTLGPLGTASPTGAADPATVDAPYDGSERRALFWHSIPTETCRAFSGLTQSRVIDLIGGSPTQETCGELEPLVDVFVERYL